MTSRARVLSLLLCCVLTACDERPNAYDAGPAPRPMDSGTPQERDTGVDAEAPDKDGGGAPADLCGAGACDLLDPNACAEAGQGCVFAIADAMSAPQPQAQCLPVGTGSDGAPCTSYLDCGPGLDCATGADGPSGQCRRYCCGLNDPQGCPAGQFCGIGFEDSQGKVAAAALCDSCDTCDLRDANACGDSLGCYLLPGKDDCRACLPTGNVEPGAACAFSNDCRPGAACFRSRDGARRCISFCNLDEPSCPSPSTCTAIEGAGLPTATGLCLN